MTHGKKLANAKIRVQQAQLAVDAFGGLGDQRELVSAKHALRCLQAKRVPRNPASWGF